MGMRLPGRPGNSYARDVEAGLTCNERDDALQSVKQSSIIGNRLVGIVGPAEPEVQERLKCLRASPEHVAEWKIEKVFQGKRNSHSCRECLCGGPVRVPPGEVWILGH